VIVAIALDERVEPIILHRTLIPVLKTEQGNPAEQSAPEEEQDRERNRFALHVVCDSSIVLRITSCGLTSSNR
jgi:hypothetical protein